MIMDDNATLPMQPITDDKSWTHHHGFASLTACQTSQPPPISASPATAKSKRDKDKLLAVHVKASSTVCASIELEPPYSVQSFTGCKIVPLAGVALSSGAIRFYFLFKPAWVGQQLSRITWHSKSQERISA